MKKRVFVVFLVIIIFSGFLFGCSGAGNMVGTSGINDPDDPSSNPDAHIHDGVEYTPISVSDLDCINGDEYSIYYKILENGHYYLTEDMEYVAFGSSGDDVTLCLNGHVINMSNANLMAAMTTDSGAKMTLCNCDHDCIHYFDVTENSGDAGTTWKLTDDPSGAVDIETLNSEPSSGMKVSVCGGGLCNTANVLNQGTMNISGCFFIHNYNPVSSYLSGGNTELYIDNCKFMYNHQEDDIFFGGAVFASHKSQIRNSVFTGNTCDVMGGAVYVDGESEITGCDFRFNSSDMGGAVFCNGEVSISDCDIQNNCAETAGGGISSLCDMKVTDSTIKNNFSFVSGGGIDVTTGNSAEIENCIISGNMSYSGGGVAVKVPTGVKGCKIDNNKAFYGAGIDNCGNLSVSNTEICENRMLNSQELNTYFPNYSKVPVHNEDYRGEGLLWEDGTLTLSGKVVIDNNRLDTDNEEDNLFIDNNQLTDFLVNVEPEGISADSIIGVSIMIGPGTKDYTDTIMKISNCGEYYNYFASDSSEYKIGLHSGSLVIAKKTETLDSDPKIYDISLYDFKKKKTVTIIMNGGDTIYINPMGGEWKGSGKLQQIRVSNNVNIENPIKAGKTFAGWLIDDMGNGIMNVSAVWK